MRLTRKPVSGRGQSRESKEPSSSIATTPSFSRQNPLRRPSRQNMEALVTLFKRDSTGSSSSGREEEALDDNVSMSMRGQKVIPATFNLVPIEGKDAVTSSDCADDPATFDQAGGHDGTFRSDGSTLVKKVTDREATFYEHAEEGLWPAALLPKFYGREDSESIKIENLTHGFARPCVMDLKMGVQTVEDDESSLLKKVKMRALDVVTRSKSAGCRLEGLSMYRTLENRRVKGTKAQSHSISAHVNVSLQDVLTFFLTDESGVRTDLALRFQTAIEGILRQFQKNDKYRFIGSSILLIYDNDNYTPYMRWARALRKLHLIDPSVRLREDQISGLTRRTKCDVRMIDFAHTGPMPKGMTTDEGYITGLHTILKALKAIRVFRAKPIFSLLSAVVDVMEESRANAKSASEEEGSPFAEGGFTFGTLLGELTPLEEGSEGSQDRPPKA